jgi:phage shock protein PspC (stress-responsive transcriptional regulator)
VKTARADGALLAGVCAGIARAFDWNAWALRALFVIFLLFKTLWAIVAYAALAVVFYLLDSDRPGHRKSSRDLESPELAGRSRRISDLEKRFEELERRH